jgi:hypothetical protein
MTATAYYMGQQLESRHNGYRIEVADVSWDDNVAVLASGKRVNTTPGYLDACYKPVGDA